MKAMNGLGMQSSAAQEYASNDLPGSMQDSFGIQTISPLMLCIQHLVLLLAGKSI